MNYAEVKDTLGFYVPVATGIPTTSQFTKTFHQWLPEQLQGLTCMTNVTTNLSQNDQLLQKIHTPNV